MATLRTNRLAKLGNGFREKFILPISLGRDGNDRLCERLRTLIGNGLGSGGGQGKASLLSGHVSTLTLARLKGTIPIPVWEQIGRVASSPMRAAPKFGQRHPKRIDKAKEAERE